MDATLTVGNYNISAATAESMNSGTPTMLINGVAQTPTGWAVTGGLTNTKNSEGLSFANGKITYDGTSTCVGRSYVITGTYKRGTSGLTVSASATVNVARSGQNIPLV
jgi:hypothetical protein